MKSIKLFNLSIKKKIKKKIIGSILKNIDNTDFIKGKNVRLFEEKFKKIINSKYCISCNSGTDALFLILKSLDLKKSDEVITTSNTWISTSEAIVNAGAKPIFVDFDEDFNINPSLIKKKITKNTKAILVVHLYGLPCKMDQIMKICNTNKIKLVEDCAQAHMSKYGNKYVGNFGIASAFSFFPTKNLGSFGDAGCVITNDLKLSKKLRMIANHGYKKKHFFEVNGVNSRMDTIQASILLEKLKYLKKDISYKNKLAKIYYKNLNNIKEVSFTTPESHIKHSYYLFTIKAKQRNKLKNYLSSKGVQTGIYYPNLLPFQKVYSKYKIKKADFKTGIDIHKEILSLPINSSLSTGDIEYCCLQIKNFYKLKVK